LLLVLSALDAPDTGCRVEAAEAKVVIVSLCEGIYRENRKKRSTVLNAISDLVSQILIF